MNIPDRIKENKKRKEELFSPYNPFKGIGSPIERFKFNFTDNDFVFLPVEMKNEIMVKGVLQFDSLEQFFIETYGKDSNSKMYKTYRTTLLKLRVKYDFEFWGLTCVIITDKISKLLIPFILRKPQRKVLEKLEQLRRAGVPIRIILLKARQWGGSTLIQLYMAWIQLFHKKNWHSAVIASIEEQARHIRGMFSTMAKQHPEYIQPVTFLPYMGSNKNKIIKERGAIIGIGSVEKPDNLRTFDFAMIHLSEVGMWRSTLMKSAEDLAQNLRASVPDTSYTLIALESTAKGVGNFFHREWQEAVNGNSGYTPIFIPWFEIEIYQRDISNINSFIKNMTEYDWVLWELGATLEGINWYNHRKSSENYSTWRMQSEFPSTAAEAFASTGRRVFAPSYVLKARKNCMAPAFIGEIYGDSSRGKTALKNIKIEENSKGNLRIWIHPDSTVNMKNRFCVFMDIGGRTEKADYTVIKVLDRYWLTEGGVPEVAAVWRGHLDQDLAAWKAAQIAKIYDNALLAVEMNSLNKEEENNEGDHFLTVLDEIAPHYDNLFSRTTPDQIKQGIPVKYGFHTNKSTKPMIIDCLNAALREESYVERDIIACDEMDTFEIKRNGSYGAVSGQHDDNVIVTAGTNWLSSSYMDLPKLFVKKKKSKKRRIISEASL